MIPPNPFYNNIYWFTTFSPITCVTGGTREYTIGSFHGFPVTQVIDLKHEKY